ncbi:alcohol dehydrogenase catalytic domain-containing protein [Nocardioides alcanivorans]|uniref:alcohol dehydrogenase catalytic domain-containing protein n=1 Tax=Nocardioides alcanivorans TaxID=2897352 RepID=UPI001F449C97|nr:zinc-binding dehydrogenase [Nocardioides alcanivorans]
MRAAVLRGGRLVVDEIPEPPEPKPDQVVVEVLANGICGTDLHVVADLDGWWDATERANDLMKLFDRERDVVIGHEFAGRVLRVGAEVGTVAVGDLVYCMPLAIAPDGALHCLGFSNDYPGGFAERATVDASMVVPLPDGLRAEHATFLDPMGVGEYAVNHRARIPAGEPAVVIGTGPVGLGVVAALRRAGASTIVAVEPTQLRREAAAKVGADVTVDPGERSWTEVWAELGFVGPAYVFDTSGAPGMVPRLVEEVPMRSVITSVASGTREEPLKPSIAVKKDLTIHFAMGGSTEIYARMAEELVAGRPDVSDLVTTIGLDDVADAFVALRTPTEHVKVAVLPGA